MMLAIEVVAGSAYGVVVAFWLRAVARYLIDRHALRGGEAIKRTP